MQFFQCETPELCASLAHLADQTSMCDAGNRASLIQNERAHECAGSDEEYVVYDTAPHFIENVRCHDDRAATAAGSAGMLVGCVDVVY